MKRFFIIIVCLVGSTYILAMQKTKKKIKRPKILNDLSQYLIKVQSERPINLTSSERNEEGICTKESEITLFQMSDKKTIMACNNYCNLSCLLLFDSKKVKEIIEAYKIPMVEPIQYDNKIITAAGSVIKIFNSKLELTQEIKLKDNSFAIQKLWLIDDHLCAQIKKYDKQQKGVLNGYNAICWEFQTEEEPEDILGEFLNEKEGIVRPLTLELKYVGWKEDDDGGDWQDDECGCCIVS